MGAFCGPHKSYGNMCTLDYAGGYVTREVNMPKPQASKKPFVAADKGGITQKPKKNTQDKLDKLM